MDQFILSQKLSELTQDEVDKLSSPMTIIEAEFVVKTLLRKQYPGLSLWILPDDLMKKE